jgi:hypothetical protein
MYTYFVIKSQKFRQPAERFVLFLSKENVVQAA